MTSSACRPTGMVAITARSSSAAENENAARYDTLRETPMPNACWIRSAKWPSKRRSTTWSSGLTARPMSAAWRLVSSSVETTTSAWQPPTEADWRVSSSAASPTISGTPSRRASAPPRGSGTLSIATTSTPKSQSWAITRVPTLPSPTTTTCPERSGWMRPECRASRALTMPSTTTAVISGISASPARLSTTCMTCSAADLSGFGSCPVRVVTSVR